MAKNTLRKCEDCGFQPWPDTPEAPMHPDERWFCRGGACPNCQERRRARSNEVDWSPADDEPSFGTW